MKNTKDSCIGILMEGTLYGKRKRQGISYGNGKDTFNNVNDFDTKAIAVGTQWIAKGSVADPDKLTEDGEIDELNDPYQNADYYYYSQCTVLAGRIGNDGLFLDGAGPVGEKVPFVCYIDICYGIWSKEENVEVADCVFLRGLTKGRLDASFGTETLYAVNDFDAAVIGGTGRFTGVIGIGQVFPGPSPGPTNGRGWQIDLDTSVSPWYPEVPLPPKLDFTAVPP